VRSGGIKKRMMKLDTLFEANKVAAELRQWQDMELRLSLGDGFFQIMFKAYKAKTLPDEYDKVIKDEATINAFKKFVKSMVKKCEDEIAAM